MLLVLQAAKATGDLVSNPDASRPSCAATDHYQRLLDLADETGDRNFQFEARQGLGRLQLATGQPGAALGHHQRALALAIELGQPDDQARTQRILNLGSPWVVVFVRSARNRPRGG